MTKKCQFTANKKAIPRQNNTTKRRDNNNDDSGNQFIRRFGRARKEIALRSQLQQRRSWSGTRLDGFAWAKVNVNQRNYRTGQFLQKHRKTTKEFSIISWMAKCSASLISNNFFRFFVAPCERRRQSNSRALCASLIGWTAIARASLRDAIWMLMNFKIVDKALSPYRQL